MADLVHGVHGNPAQRSLERSWVVVHDGPFPVVESEAREHVPKEKRCVTELARDDPRLLLGVAVVLDALVATHWVEGRNIHPASRENSLTLNEQHVAQMAAVFER